jgi:hypothetical protein
MVQRKQDCCITDGDCHDGKKCTRDRCDRSSNECVFEPIEGCCTEDSDCHDGDPCTIDRCRRLASSCRYRPNPRCASDGGVTDAGSVADGGSADAGPFDGGKTDPPPQFTGAGGCHAAGGGAAPGAWLLALLLAIRRKRGARTPR